MYSNNNFPNNNQTSDKDILARILLSLPQKDCGGIGGCKKSSCAECASAVLESKNPGLCPACTQAQIDAIAAILNVESVAAKNQKAFSACAGDAAGHGRFMAAASCAEAKNFGSLPGECKYGCLGVGDCISSCKFDAISRVDGKIVIDREKCTGCEACMSVCPQKLISMTPGDAVVFVPCSSCAKENEIRDICGYGCIGCHDCEEACPEDAIKVIDGHAVIDYEKCAGCVACTVKCRKKIIVNTSADLKTIKEEVAFVKCSGKPDKAAFYSKGIDNCIDADNFHVSKDKCSLGCLGLGSCVSACRFGAISVENGCAKVDPEKCVGCRDCTFACPKGLITMVPYSGSKLVACSAGAKGAAKCSSGCIGCLDCVSNCPNQAISDAGGLAAVDPEKCANCSICTNICSRKVMHELEVPEYIYLQKKALDELPV
ncbi:MAG: 4Fe-4S binding protein [Firmicutes bacterium]|nr:4Fe-4S binding protein [Bacillota bacterium]